MWILLLSSAMTWVTLGLPCSLNSLKSGVTVPSEIHGCKESGSGRRVGHSTWSCEFEGDKKPANSTTLPPNTPCEGFLFSPRS